MQLKEQAFALRGAGEAHGVALIPQFDNGHRWPTSSYTFLVDIVACCP